MPDQQLAPPRKSPAGAQSRRFGSVFFSAQSSQIWSRVSQNAAALLFDFAIVDIR